MPDEKEICGKEKDSKPGEVCTYEAKYPDGRCGYHTEESKVGKQTGVKKATNIRHGMNMERSDYYKALPDREKMWIDALAQSFLDEAPFDEGHQGKVELLRQVAIDFHKRRRVNDIIGEEGLMVEKTVGGNEFETFTNLEEHPLHLTADRLARTNIRLLKELGCLGNDDKTSEESAATLIEILSGTAKKAESD